MGLSLLQKPAKLTPAGNDQVFFATSTNSGVANHTYTIVVTDVITGINAKYQIFKDPIYSSMVWDAKEFVQQFIQIYKPLLIGGFQAATGSIRPITVNVGETYGSTPTYYPAVSNYSYTVWSGQLDFLDFSDGVFDASLYIYDSTVNNAYMSGVTNDLAFTGRSSFIYFLSDFNTGTRLPGIRIETYDSTGTMLVSAAVANPFSAGGNTYDKNFIFINVGDSGLQSLGISVTNVAFYKIYDDSVPNVLIKTFTYGCENFQRAKLIHYLAKNGAIQTASFNMKDETVIRSQQTQYGKNPNENVGTFYSYNFSSSPIKSFGIESQRSIKLRTDWLSEDQINKYAELFDSPVCWLEGDDRYATKLIAMHPATPEYKVIKKRNQKLYALEEDFIYAHKNYRQRV